ncbi:DUF2147 domain-containing protein [Celeribacter halophilus]|uniref:DUF2147 domain-containing protein n=1 Tax=Celeribacter halophilus TaxID=576117 RepID=A0AAW7XUR6_9RHOB|nr:DUF2147 domain-containing protein [Celeribacter halophilus]MDO6456772.1 DUF2147 domain-containing protein [Celeribacter halophilus]MDO6725290.1 DUF2147 domain-containing protein [Celeribacter halophilus]
MKYFALAAVAALGLAGPALAADPVEGIWKTQVDDGHYAHVKIAPCGEHICGVIAKAFDANGPIASENIGKPIVWDMSAAGGGSYKNGKIWQPSTGKIFNSKMTLSGNSLKVKGCVGPICKGQTWSRVQ